MKADLPTPTEILEELADRVAQQIDRRAPVAFDSALSEMTRYHRFLLSANASQSPDGAPFSYAEIAGNAWNPPHRDWVRQYSRLMARAAEAIPDDDHFIRSLTRVPMLLLPRPGDPALPPKVIQVLLDLGPMMMHRVEGWVTRRTTTDTPPGGSATPRITMAGSDAKAYANVLPDIVGAWESLLKVVPSVFDWKERSDADDARAWSSYRAAWPFLWQHLSNTAYCLAVAVWNEDAAAAALFREALVRWADALDHRLPEHAELRWRRLLYPDVLDLDWAAATARAAPLAYAHSPSTRPGELFAAVLRNCHADVLLVTAALLLRWTMEGKQASDIGARTAAELGRQEGASDQEFRPERQPPDLRKALLDFARIELAGSGFRDGSHGARVDELVRSLDNMTERRVVPGRVFTPSTSHAWDDLRLATVTLLTAAADVGGTEAAVGGVVELAAREDLLPRADASCRELDGALRNVEEAASRDWPQVASAFAVLRPARDLAAAKAALLSSVAAARSAIETARLARLKARQVDGAKLEAIRAAAEASLLTTPAKVPLFRDVVVERAQGVSDAADRTFRVNCVTKAGLVEPPMEPPSSNFDGFMASQFARAAGRQAWHVFAARPRQVLELPHEVDSPEFWDEVAAKAALVGPEPVLVVPNGPAARSIRLRRRGQPKDEASRQIEQRARQATGASYLGSVHGVDVYGADFEAVSWLFSATAMKRLVYYETPAGKADASTVGIDYALDDDTTGTLSLSYRQLVHFEDWPVFEFRTTQAFVEVQGPQPPQGPNRQISQPRGLLKRLLSSFGLGV
jgi:hypothetical protein